jgi:hypothetical protein
VTPKWGNSVSLIISKIISALDDQSLSATPNALDLLFTSPLSSVGIFPDPDTSQQLLFFLKAPLSNQCAISG